MDDYRETNPLAGLATLAIGAVLGAAAALLLAPKSGPELRTKVADKAGHWKEYAAEALAQGRERMVAAVEQTQADRTDIPEPPIDSQRVNPV
jgi:gas vesicle protein